jgi:hypothetical protein
MRDGSIKQFTMYDINGRKLLEKSFSDSTQISTEMLESGIYFYWITNAAGTIKKGKIIKE